MNSAPIRVLIADDHVVVREGLRALMDAQPGIMVVGEADGGEEAWRLAKELQPDVLLLDVSMPNGGGAEAAERFARDFPRVKVLVLTMHEERGYVTRLLRSGAAGYALKRSAASELLRAIRTVHSGERYVDPSLAGTLLTESTARHRRASHAEADQLVILTPRESEVLHLLALGHSNKEVASTLSISVKTVETHRASGMARLGVASRAALVRYAMTVGWMHDA